MKWEEARIVPRLQRHEAAISRWRYEGVYSFYNAEEAVSAERPDQPAGEDSFVMRRGQCRAPKETTYTWLGTGPQSSQRRERGRL